MEQLSVAIITKNEEVNIRRCLSSLQWAHEIIVVDAFSSDKTVERASEMNARVIQRQWSGYADQKEFAVGQCTHEWILSVDADEVVTEELQKEILSAIQSNPSFNGFEIPRKSYFLGKWIRYGGWYPGYQLRLFRKSKTRMNHRPVHEGFLTEGEKGTFQSALFHYTYRSIHQYIEKMNDYTSLDSVNKLKNGKKISWIYFIANPLSLFLRMFISLRGYKDGFHGFLLAYYSAMSTLVLYAKCWEYQTAASRGMEVPPSSSTELEAIKRLAS